MLGGSKSLKKEGAVKLLKYSEDNSKSALALVRQATRERTDLVAKVEVYSYHLSLTHWSESTCNMISSCGSFAIAYHKPSRSSYICRESQRTYWETKPARYTIHYGFVTIGEMIPGLKWREARKQLHSLIEGLSKLVPSGIVTRMGRRRRLLYKEQAFENVILIDTIETDNNGEPMSHISGVKTPGQFHELPVKDARDLFFELTGQVALS